MNRAYFRADGTSVRILFRAVASRQTGLLGIPTRKLLEGSFDLITLRGVSKPVSVLRRDFTIVDAGVSHKLLVRLADVRAKRALARAATLKDFFTGD